VRVKGREATAQPLALEARRDGRIILQRGRAASRIVTAFVGARTLRIVMPWCVWLFDLHCGWLAGWLHHAA
jgi:hypothetical protein